MTTIWTVSCPSCEQHISLSSSLKTYRCEHCGADLLVSPEATNHSAEQPPFRLISLSGRRKAIHNPALPPAPALPHATLLPITPSPTYPQEAWQQPISYTYKSNGIMEALESMVSDARTYEEYQARRMVPPSPEITIRQTGAITQIEYSWLRPLYILQFLFCLAWSSFAFFWTAEWLQSGGFFIPHIVIFPIAGIGMLYWSLAHLINHTKIEIGAHQIRVMVGPLPYFDGNCLIQKSDIVRLAFVTTPIYGRGISHIKRTVRAWLRSGKQVTLASQIVSPEQAKSIMQEIGSRIPSLQ